MGGGRQYRQWDGVPAKVPFPFRAYASIRRSFSSLPPVLPPTSFTRLHLSRVLRFPSPSFMFLLPYFLPYFLPSVVPLFRPSFVPSFLGILPFFLNILAFVLEILPSLLPAGGWLAGGAASAPPTRSTRH
jgi:hypothetical protein